MAAKKSDVVKSDPIETLTKASNLSLVGGGAMLFVALWGVQKINEDKWTVQSEFIMTAIVGAILLGLAATFARVYDARLRAQLAIKLIEKTGTSDPETATKLAKAAKSLMETPFGHYIVNPNATVESPPNDSNAPAENGDKDEIVVKIPFTR